MVSKGMPLHLGGQSHSVMMSPGWPDGGFWISELITVKQVLLPGGFLADELWGQAELSWACFDIRGGFRMQRIPGRIPGDREGKLNSSRCHTQ